MHLKFSIYLFAAIFAAQVCLGTLALATTVRAAPALQAGEVTLAVANRSTQTICKLWLSASTATEWGDNRLGAEPVAPGDTYVLDVAPASYDLMLAGCDSSLLLQERALDITSDHELVVTDAAIKRAQCQAQTDQGTELFYGGRLAEAQTAWQIAAICYREIGDRVKEGMTLNDIGMIYRTQGRFADALDQYQAALAIRRAAGDSWGEGVTLHNIGSIYLAQGRDAEALKQFEAALPNLRAIGDVAGEGTTRNNIGQVYAAQGRNPEALAQYERALALVREGGDRRVEATVLNNIGALYSSQGRYADAFAQYEAVLAIAVEGGYRALEAGAHHNIGSMYGVQGRTAEEMEQYEAALAIAREVGDRAGEGQVLRSIGSFYSKQERYGAAIDQLEAALAIALAIGDRAMEGQILGEMGGLYHRQGRFDAAQTQYEAALAIQRELGDRAGESSTLTSIGATYDAMGRDVDALVEYNKALELARKVGERFAEGAALNAIGTLLIDEGQYAPARESLEAALAIARELENRPFEGRTLGNLGMLYHDERRYAEALEQHQAALAIEREVGDRSGQWATLGNIGAIYQDQAQFADALKYYLESISILEELRAVAGSEGARASFIGQYSNAYDRAITVYLATGQTAAAFGMSERGRARAFLDSLATGQVELADDEAAELLAAEQETFAARQAAQDAVAMAKAANPPDEQLVGDLEQQLSEVEAAHAKALAAIQARRDQLGALAPGRSNSVLGAQQVQALLDEDTTLVSYWLFGDTAAAFVLTAEKLESVALPEATTSNITTTLASLYAWPNKENARPRPLRNLYKWLVQPLAGKLQTKHVAIVPHQELHTVPFAALTDGEGYFGAAHTLTVLPSASALRFLADNARRAQSTGDPLALVFGNPQTNLPGLPSLPAAEAEADAVADLLGAAVYTGTAASEQELRQLVSGKGILHLAAHGGYDPADPLASMIALAPGGGEDGKLEAREIFGLPLRGSSLVVLSACETNVGALSRGDEVVGLTRAFFFAGAPTVMSSLWSVNDAATEALMTSFYEHWLSGGMSKAEALQAAQADIRGNSRWVSPFYWAAFVLNGDPGQAGNGLEVGTP